MSEYTEAADKFLTDRALEFRAVLIGSDCPTFCKDAAMDRDMGLVNTFPRPTHIHGKHYRCTISGAGRGHVSFDFWNSYADENSAHKTGRRAKVTAYDLLACITKHDPGAFDDFCSDFGYDIDSRKAEYVYRAVVAEFRKVEKFFTADELEALQEIQ